MRYLIEKYIRGECSEKELQQVLDYLKSKPEELEQFFSEEEWKQFETEELLDERVSERLLEDIHDSINRQPQRIAWFKKFSAVAAILVCFLLIHFFTKTEVNHLIAVEDTLLSDTIINLNSHAERIVLPDGSIVMLSGNSKMVFSKEFNTNRTVALIGAASFSVTKNIEYPFIVSAGSLKATVLGTVFTISNYPADEMISVYLQQGKLKVESSENTHNMLSGDVLHYNILNDKVLFLPLKEKTTPKGVVRSVPKGEMATVHNWYHFNNQKLSTVFDQLMVLYDVQIAYNANDITTINFIGKLDRGDDIRQILEDICKLNNLKLTQNDTIFNVLKH